MKQCKVHECDRISATNGMCNAHYLRVRDHGDARPNDPIKPQGDGTIKFCSTGCGRVVIARGYCTTHYMRWRTNGDAGEAALRRIPGDADRTEKPCTVCKVVKPIEDFHRDKRCRDGKMSSCKSCYGKKEAAGTIARKYGLSPKQHLAMREAQGHRCAMCRREVKLVVDHCHRNGNVRALLCDRCNRLLGVADDEPGLLRSAIGYLEKHA